MSNYADALSACRWMNEFCDTHRVLNCRRDMEGQEPYWLVTEIGNTDMGHGEFMKDAQLIQFAKRKGWTPKGDADE